MRARARRISAIGLWAGLAALLLLLTGCGRFDERPAPIRGSEAPATPAPPVAGAPGEPRSRYGNPEFYEVLGKRYFPLKSARGFVERGIASWYGAEFHGRLTSMREPYDMYQMTAAHKELPLPTLVEVTNLENGRKAVLRVNDRGPFKDNRIIDLSYAAALKLGVYERGTAFVEVRALDRRPAPAPAPTMMASAAPVTTDAPAAPAAAEAPRMYLQIGAFGERANAERLQARIRDALRDGVRIFEDAAAASRPLYKVQVGPIADVAHADDLVSRLAGLGISEHHFTSN